jgi:Cft2 family RNA processing exonuclease
MGLMEYPLFTHTEVDKIIDTWRTAEYQRPLDLADEVKLSFHDAGHLLGSSGVLIEAHGQRIFYTGDVNFEDQTIMRGAKFPTGSIDTLIVETTRGDAPRRADYSRAAEIEKLATAIGETIEAGGSVLLPVFALGKSQEMLMTLHLLQTQGRLPDVPIFLGGLSTKITTIYDEFADRGDRQQKGFRLLSGVPTLQRNARSRKKKKRKPMEYQAGAIYLLSSGMMTEGTVSYEFAYQIAGNPANAVFFVGYTDSETPGYAFKHAKAGEPILLTPTSRPLIINCRRETFDFSGHSEREAIRRYCVGATPKRIILVHGDLSAMEWFQQTLAKDLPQCEIIIAQPNETLSLD